MKPRTLLVLSIVATAILVGLLVPKGSKTKPEGELSAEVTNAPNPVPGTETNIGERTVTKPTSPQGENTQDTQENWAFKLLPPGSNLQERLEELARRRGVPLNVLTQQALAQISNRAQEVSKQMNRSIEFYGKVVDEDGLPIDRVNVYFGCIIFPENHFATNILTDADGMFALRGIDGATLNVRVSKQGYEEAPGTNQSRFVYSSPLSTGSFSPDPKSPIIFRLQKKASE